MSKRFYPEHQGDRKRAKLNISISDHNFPLSQNNDQNKDADGWGDDNDDEILLMASQACEEAYSTSDISLLPDYSMCMQPESTSTQLNLPGTSKNEFTFKKPIARPSSLISTQMKERCSRISSPLPGITSKMIPPTNGLNELSDDDFIFSDKIFKGQDSDHTYRQLLQLQEDNAKLKSENGKLLEKCVTKEGEASILRMQLKSSQVSVDNARLEKIKAQEKVQMEWTDKLTAANNQMSDLRTQLDFKNLEIISIKEKCKKLESTKVRLTQVTVANNDITSSQRRQSASFKNESMTQSRKVKVTTNAVQTDDKAQFMVLNTTISKERPTLSTILPFIMEPSPTNQSLIDYNEKLSRRDAPQKCRVYSTFHRIPSTPKIKDKIIRVQLSSVYEDLTCIASGGADKEKYFNVFNAANSVMAEAYGRLETISRRMTTAFQKEMDEKYIEASSTYLDVKREDLLKGRTLFKEEQEILSRRLIAMLAHILECPNSNDMFRNFELSAGRSTDHFLESISRICSAIDNASCATLYSGLLFSITLTIQTLLHTNNKIILEVIKSLLRSRPMTFVVIHILILVRKVSVWENFVKSFCPKSNIGNLKMDYDQGVLLYRKDSCYFQVLLKQVETCLKCIQSQSLVENAVETTSQLITLYSNINCDNTRLVQDKSRCDCQLVFIQVIVYALRICAVMLNNYRKKQNTANRLLPVCRCGIQLLYLCTLRDVELSGQLGHNEGHLMEFCEVMRTFQHEEVYANMLSELAGTLQSSPEEMPPSFHRQPWLKSFEQFSMAD